MIKAVFYEAACEFRGFEISGHEEHEGEFGMICAAVSSCTMLVCNAITENFGANAEVTVEENRILLRLKNGYGEAAMKLLAAFYSHIEAISEDYGNIKLTIIEEGYNNDKD